ncbi:hypothetical protein ASG17_12625 [Brevundimonas sp. Leaf363]|uniref:winged helix-turn-helix domain-containing protein n=1 Tax=Brevundimonas sp. Leaf363 TaxID=1736353 RepID=UPI0006F8469E|nr:winged helix-turn-helix domain-containing protein [Brevundimonas sp. Leaf363]KQS53806.1 hypothetical protein ASG17_12625 [Brevundimonas sp. Leaf363]
MTDPARSPRRVLLVERNQDLATFARTSLATPEWAVDVKAGAATAVASAGHDLVIVGQVDASSEDDDVITALRRHARCPLIPLFRPSLWKSRAAVGLRASGPFLLAMADCRSRIDQHLRHALMPAGMGLDWGGFQITLKADLFEYEGSPLDLTEVQSAIASTLMRSAGEIIPKAVLQAQIFGTKPAAPTNVLEVHISRLRTKLRAAKTDIAIEHVRGQGYVLFWHPPLSKTPLPQPEPYLLVEGARVRFPELPG